MSVATFEGVVKAGQIRLQNGPQLPEDAVVYVVVPNYEKNTVYQVTIPDAPHIATPRLVNPQDAEHFVMTVSEVGNAAV